MMSNPITNILEKGYQIFQNDQELAKSIEYLLNSGSKIIRDVSISNKASNSDLKATNSDFWFHTDGVFMTIPPHWVVIKVLSTESGGGLELLDSTAFIGNIKNKSYKFGNNDNFLVTNLIENHNNSPIFRYRRDYMLKNFSDEQQDDVDEVIKDNIINKIDIGELQIGHSIIIDNWRFLHRRKPFIGERTIRRVWIS